MTTTEIQTIELDVIDVGCGNCGAQPGSNCLSNKGVPYATRRFHPERVEFRDYFVDKATGNTDLARWWRWKLRNVGPSAPAMPHGTMATYQRHKRAGEEPCDVCTAAARAYWVEQNNRLRKNN